MVGWLLGADGFFSPFEMEMFVQQIKSLAFTQLERFFLWKFPDQKIMGGNPIMENVCG